MGSPLRFLATSAMMLLTASALSCDRTSTEPSPTCSIAIDPASRAFGSAGGSGSVGVTATPSSCAWIAASTASWITVTGGANGSGAGTVTYAVQANTSPSARNASILVGSQVHTIAQDGQTACAYEVTPAHASFSEAGGPGAIEVSSTASCTWTAQTSDPWITIASGATGQGPGVVTYAVTANPGTTTRTGFIRVAGVDVEITQSSAGCSFAVSPQNAAYTADAAQGTIDVTAPASCAWSASATEPWLSITSGSGGQGPGTVRYAVSTNTGTESRTGTIRVAGSDVRVTQAGDASTCEYVVAPVAFSPCMPASTMTATITTGASCTWTSSANTAWVTIAAGQSGIGPGVIRFSTTDNYDAPRSAVVMVRWPTPTQGQNIQVAQAGCTYAVSRNTFTIPATGGTDRFDVYQSSVPNTCGGALQDGCLWRATSEVGWITITTGMPVRGDNAVSFTVAPNQTGASRTGVIHVQDKVVVVTQPGS